MGICISRQSPTNKEEESPPPVYEETPPPPPPVVEVSIGCIREEALQHSLRKLRTLVETYVNEQTIREALEEDPYKKHIWIPESKRPRVRQETVDLWNKNRDNITLELRDCEGARKDGSRYKYKYLCAILDDDIILTERGTSAKIEHLGEDSTTQ